ncbi:MAG: ribonuclease P protein component [Candidatus Levybacteria bacterium]|nr:ribonuclease P protein component [Candidatus Levybacteria bacterium]
MLNKINRLPARTKIKEGSKISSRFFLIKIQSNTQGVSRFGFIVSKKISKTAVGRNRIKRFLRICVEKNLDDIKAGIDFLIIAKEESVKASFSQIFFEFNKILNKNYLIK